MSFTDLAISKSLEHDRSLKMMEKINDFVEWANIEAILLEHYDVGKSKEGADAFPPLLLMKCMLLQKWFHIPSDPELENQIKGFISFKKFSRLSLDKPFRLKLLEGEILGKNMLYWTKNRGWCLDGTLKSTDNFFHIFFGKGPFSPFSLKFKGLDLEGSGGFLK